MIKISKGERIFRVFNAILMVLFIVITFYPLYDVIMARRGRFSASEL